MSTPVLEIQGVTKQFDDKHVLQGIDLKVAEHTAVVMIGASGSGKSTLLRCINLLVDIDDGDILLDGEVVTDRRWIRSASAARWRWSSSTSICSRT
jgi:polar amino acid transport system ATP-binding protein